MKKTNEVINLYNIEIFTIKQISDLYNGSKYYLRKYNNTIGLDK